MSLQKEMAKCLVARESVKHLQPYWYERPGGKELTGLRKIVSDNIRPMWFRWVKGPYERWEYNNLIRRLRDEGVAMDDCWNDKDILVERAVDLLPRDLVIGRYRRQMRGATLYNKRKNMPENMLNYDPMIPYLAPYLEEAKFMIQEEMELVGYHNWDRSLFKGGVSGFGEKHPHMTHLTNVW